jgi:V/A-type H+-transporting ATPase subunit B
LFACYARAMHIRLLASVMGEDSLPEVDRRFLAFGRAFEEQLVNQRGRRTLEESMAVGWALLRALPTAELSRLSREQVERYLAPPRGETPSNLPTSGASDG